MREQLSFTTASENLWLQTGVQLKGCCSIKSKVTLEFDISY